MKELQEVFHQRILFYLNLYNLSDPVQLLQMSKRTKYTVKGKRAICLWVGCTSNWINYQILTRAGTISCFTIWIYWPIFIAIYRYIERV